MIRDYFLRLDAFFIKKTLHLKNVLVFSYLSKIGHFMFCFFVIVFFYLIPIKEFKEFAILFLFSIFLDTVIIFFIKNIVKRKRHYKEGFYLIKIDPYSFPSGHVSRMASFIVPIISYPIISSFFLIFSIVGALARMVKGYHYFTDCSAGLLVGILSGLITLLNKNAILLIAKSMALFLFGYELIY